MAKIILIDKLSIIRYLLVIILSISSCSVRLSMKIWKKSITSSISWENKKEYQYWSQAVLTLIKSVIWIAWSSIFKNSRIKY